MAVLGGNGVAVERNDDVILSIGSIISTWFSQRNKTIVAGGIIEQVQGIWKFWYVTSCFIYRKTYDLFASHAEDLC